ncbi:hypothetical protein E2562_029307 [Oryza meyeriana var. granulata]|uniref:Uncharacterized protein n=1 Tax=Oryza meyeriana var. granulata TaxID=110450 RepID=A0A6G1E3L3_9ORYZ|nr:hypothetical protein E2562_029307 [Oryza meyeriana var. granulata]
MAAHHVVAIAAAMLLLLASSSPALADTAVLGRKGGAMTNVVGEIRRDIGRRQHGDAGARLQV